MSMTTVLCHTIIATGENTAIVRASVVTDETGLYDEGRDVLVALSDATMADARRYCDVMDGLDLNNEPTLVTVPLTAISFER